MLNKDRVRGPTMYVICHNYHLYQQLHSFSTLQPSLPGSSLLSYTGPGTRSHYRRIDRPNEIKVSFCLVSVELLLYAYSGMFCCHSIFSLSQLPLYPIGRIINHGHHKLRASTSYNSMIFLDSKFFVVQLHLILVFFKYHANFVEISLGLTDPIGCDQDDVHNENCSVNIGI